MAGSTAVEAIRGEIGASLMETRQMEATLLFVKDGIQSDFEIIRNTLRKDWNGKRGEWIQKVDAFLKTINISWEEMDREELRNRISPKYWPK